LVEFGRGVVEIFRGRHQWVWVLFLLLGNKLMSEHAGLAGNTAELSQ